MVHFPGFARTRLWIHRAVVRFYRTGFPHSEIPGSKPACGSPRLIAACHVLHRLLLPRHPPCALSSLTIKFTRHTPTSFLPSAIRLQPKSSPITPANPIVPKSCSSRAHPTSRVTHTSRHLGTHKNLLSLVDCPIYSVVKHRPHRTFVRLPRLSGLSIATQSSTPKRLAVDRNDDHGCRSWRPTSGSCQY